MNTAKLKSWTNRNVKGDLYLWGIIILLLLFSIVFVFSAVGGLAAKRADGSAMAILLNHTMHVGLALFFAWFSHRINYKWYWAFGKIAIWISAALILFAYFKGVTVNGAGRWIMIPFINQTFQPSDLAKIALIANLARMLTKRQEIIEKSLTLDSVEHVMKYSMWPAIAQCSFICGLIALSNFSTSIILFLTCLLLMYIGRVPLKQLALFCLVAVLLSILGLKMGQRWDTAVKRWDYFMKGELSDQAKLGHLLVYEGGWIGKGPANAAATNVVPSVFSDFIFGNILAEFGLLLGGIPILGLYLALLFRGLKTVARSDRPFGGLLSAGLCFSIVIQAMVNMGVAVGLGPVTGQTLPLISMGGTSMMFTGIALGIVLSVSRGDITEESTEEEEIPGGNSYRDFEEDKIKVPLGEGDEDE